MGQMKKEIRAGAPGGRKFAGLSFLARRRGSGNRLRPDKPLSRLAIAVRYYVASRDPLEFHVGWSNPGISQSWRRIAIKQQEGFTHGMREATREAIIGMGARMTRRARNRRYFFIKRSTRTFRTPARPILDPFWRAHEDDARRNITRNFRRKMRGERI